jgi:glycine/sarcosine N-methyltransferase
MNAYDQFSADYDRFVNWEERFAVEMPFLLSQLGQLKTADRSPVRVLDSACGTGMHAIRLAQEGFITAGTDLNENMVKRAQANAREAQVNAVFKTAGFGEISDKLYKSPLLPFDALLCLGNSLPHLTTPATVGAALTDMADCLRPGGLLLLQNRNFDLVMREKQRWLGTQSHREEDNEWLFLRFYDFEPDGLITFNIIRLHRHDDEPWQEHISSVQLFPLKKELLIGLLQDSGFSDISAYGAMSDQPFDPASSGNLVISARKA